MSQSSSLYSRDEAFATPQTSHTNHQACGGYYSSESHSNRSPTPTSPGPGWSTGSPALSITSIDPGSPGLRFKVRPSAPPPPAGDYEGDWAADVRQKASNYLQYVGSLSSAYESQLAALCVFFEGYDGCQWKNNTYTDEPTVKIIEVNRDGSRCLVGIDDMDTLIEYLGEQENNNSTEGQPVLSQVFLLDRVTPAIIGFFGARFDVEPQFWNAHLTLAKMGGASSGQLVRYGDESGSKVSFWNIPVLKRCSSASSETIGRTPYKENSGDGEDNESGPSFRLYEGCSIYLDHNSSIAGVTNILIITSNSDAHPQSCSKSLRTSFVEQMMVTTLQSESFVAERPTSGDTSSEAACTFALMLDLIKAIIHHLDSTLDGVPSHTSAEISNFTLNIFKDESDKMRRSILEEQDVISTLSTSLRVSLATFDKIASRTSDGEGTAGVAEKLQLLVREFQDRSDQVQQWLKELDTSVVHHQRKRSAQLRRLRITLPVCSISLAMTIVILFAVQLQISGSNAKPAIDA